MGEQLSNWNALQVNHLAYHDEEITKSLRKKFFTKSLGHYAPVPSNSPSTPYGDDEDDLVNYSKIAEFFLRKDFFKLLFSTSIANYLYQECNNNPNRGYESIAFSANTPTCIEASDDFFDTGKGDLECRLCDFLCLKFLDCDEIYEVACLMLNVKRVVKPSDPLLSTILQFGIMVMNLRLSLVEVQNHCYKTPYFSHNNVVDLEFFENQYITCHSTYKKIYIFRDMPFVYPSPNNRSELNSKIDFPDKERTQWKVQPLVNYLAGEGRVFLLTKDNLSNSLRKSMEPRLAGMTYYCKTYKNINGVANIESNSMFASNECFTYSNTNFHHLGKCMVILDHRKGTNRFRTTLRRSLMEIEPIMIIEKELRIITFMETSLIRDIAPCHMTENHFIGDISLLQFNPLQLSFGSLRSPDSMIPSERLLRGYL